MVFKADVFVLGKSKSEVKDGKTYYNASVQFDGDDFSRRVSVDKEIYDDIEPKTSYDDAGFEFRSGVTRDGKSYEMFIFKSIGA